MADEEEHLLPNHTQNSTQFKTYKRRYVALLILSSLQFFQCLQWNTWGPISESAIKVFPGWNSGTIALFGGWGTITFVIFVLPACYITQVKGLRTAILSCAFLLACGTVIRCLSIVTPLFTILCHLGAILIGTAGTALLATPPLFAAQWFQPTERTTATAFCQAMNQLGNAGSYLQPLIVSAPSKATDKVIIEEIQTLMFIGALVMCALYLMILAWFPSRPPTPPSLTSSMQRYKFVPAIKHIFENGEVVALMISYSVISGIPSSWMAVLNFSLISLGMDQDEAMQLGIVSVVVSATLVVLVGRVTDQFYGHIKKSIFVLSLLATLSFVWFLLLTSHVIPVSKWQIYASVVCGVSFAYAVSPLYFELAVEMSYPAPEELVGGLFVAGNNLVGAGFLLLFLIPTTNYIWVTYCLVAASLVSFVPLFFIKESYPRSSLDRQSSRSINNSRRLYQVIG